MATGGQTFYFIVCVLYVVVTSIQSSTPSHHCVKLCEMNKTETYSEKRESSFQSYLAAQLKNEVRKSEVRLGSRMENKKV